MLKDREKWDKCQVKGSKYKYNWHLSIIIDATISMTQTLRLRLVE